MFPFASTIFHNDVVPNWDVAHIFYRGTPEEALSTGAIRY